MMGTRHYGESLKGFNPGSVPQAPQIFGGGGSGGYTDAEVQEIVQAWEDHADELEQNINKLQKHIQALNDRLEAVEAKRNDFLDGNRAWKKTALNIADRIQGLTKEEVIKMAQEQYQEHREMRENGNPVEDQ